MDPDISVFDSKQLDVLKKVKKTFSSLVTIHSNCAKISCAKEEGGIICSEKATI